METIQTDLAGAAPSAPETPPSLAALEEKRGELEQALVGKKEDVEAERSALEMAIKGITDATPQQKKQWVEDINARIEDAKVTYDEKDGTLRVEREEEKQLTFMQQLAKIIIELFKNMLREQGYEFGEDGKIRRKEGAPQPQAPGGGVPEEQGTPPGSVDTSGVEEVLQTLRREEKEAADALEACKKKIRALPQGVEGRESILRELRREEFRLKDEHDALQAKVKETESFLQGAKGEERKTQYASAQAAAELQRFCRDHGIAGAGVETTRDGVRLRIPRTSAQWGVFHDGTFERELLSMQQRELLSMQKEGSPMISYRRETGDDGSETIDFTPYRSDVAYLDGRDLEYNVSAQNRPGMLAGRKTPEGSGRTGRGSESGGEKAQASPGEREVFARLEGSREVSGALRKIESFFVMQRHGRDSAEAQGRTPSVNTGYGQKLSELYYALALAIDRLGAPEETVNKWLAGGNKAGKEYPLRYTANVKHRYGMFNARTAYMGKIEGTPV